MFVVQVLVGLTEGLFAHLLSNGSSRTLTLIRLNHASIILRRDLVRTLPTGIILTTVLDSVTATTLPTIPIPKLILYHLQVHVLVVLRLLYRLYLLSRRDVREQLLFGVRCDGGRARQCDLLSLGSGEVAGGRLRETPAGEH